MKYEKTTYFVSVKHNLIQETPHESVEFVVELSDEELTRLRDLLNDVAKSDKYAFRRTFVPYKSADHDDAAKQYDDRTIELYNFLYEHGDENSRKLIEDMNIIDKMNHTGYDNPGYSGSPTNKPPEN